MRLLAALSISNPDAAEDGPADPEILHLLTFHGSDEDHVLAVIRLAAVASPNEQLLAARELERLAREAAVQAVSLGDLIVPKGHKGDRAVNDWVAEMLGLYRAITERDPATSVGAPERPNEGKAGAPLVRFFEAAGKPLAIQLTAESWRGRIRSILTAADVQNQK